MASKKKKSSPAPAPAKKASSKKAPAKKAPAKKAPAPAKQAPSKKAVAKNATKQSPAKAPAKQAPAKKAAAKSATKRAAPAKAKASNANAIVHWEIQSQNPELLWDFYSDVFGWKIDSNNPMNYGMVPSKGDSGIGGGIGGGGPGDNGSRVLVYAEVPSIDATLEKIESKGGRTIMPRSDIGPVIMAIYTDPEGHMMGLLEPR